MGEDHRNDSQLLTLEKVQNITIGLVIAVKSLNSFENHNILSWIRKGRKVTELIEDQFALYDKLSIYLQNNVFTDMVFKNGNKYWMKLNMFFLKKNIKGGQ